MANAQTNRAVCLFNTKKKLFKGPKTVLILQPSVKAWELKSAVLKVYIFYNSTGHRVKKSDFLARV